MKNEAGAESADASSKSVDAATADPAEAMLVPVLTTEPVPLFTAVQQAAFIGRLARGSSPASACSALGLSVTALLVTMQENARFRMLLQQIEQLLSQNVAAALYRQAMEGNVAAQTFLLKSRPPPNWRSDEHTAPTPDDLERLTDAELVDLLNQAAAELSPDAAP